MGDCFLIGHSLAGCHLIRDFYSTLKREGGTSSVIQLPLWSGAEPQCRFFCLEHVSLCSQPFNLCISPIFSTDFPPFSFHLFFLFYV